MAIAPPPFISITAFSVSFNNSITLLKCGETSSLFEDSPLIIAAIAFQRALFAVAGRPYLRGFIMECLQGRPDDYRTYLNNDKQIFFFPILRHCNQHLASLFKSIFKFFLHSCGLT